jgi:AcrR family transcriptional regulator
MTVVMTTPARERMVHSAAQLMRERGLSGTGMREIAEHAEAPRGSLQHYFPDGKDQVVTEALAWITERVSAPLIRMTDADQPVPARMVVKKIFDRWRRFLVESDYLDGCPIVATVTDAVANDALRSAAAAAFATWQTSLTAALRRGGLTRLRAERISVLVISSLEGAIVLARAQRDLAPLNTVAIELDQLLAGVLRARRVAT